MAVTSTTKGTEFLNLCFHGIGTPSRRLEPDGENFWITEEQFDELLGVIVKYPAALITFDNGNASDAAIAFSALHKHDLTVRLFVIVDRLDPARLADLGLCPAHGRWRDEDRLVRQGGSAVAIGR